MAALCIVIVARRAAARGVSRFHAAGKRVCATDGPTTIEAAYSSASLMAQTLPRPSSASAGFRSAIGTSRLTLSPTACASPSPPPSSVGASHSRSPACPSVPRQFSTSSVHRAIGPVQSPASSATSAPPSPSPAPSALLAHGEGMALERAAVSAAGFTAEYMDGGVEEVLESRSIHVAASPAATWLRLDKGHRMSSEARSELRGTDIKDDGSRGGGQGATGGEGGGGRGEGQARGGGSGEGLGEKSTAPEVESAPSLHSQRSMAEHIEAARGDMQEEGERAEGEEGRGEGGLTGRGGSGGEAGENGGRGEGGIWVDDADGKGYVSLGRPTNVNGGSAEGLLGDLAHVAPLERLDSARLAEPGPEVVDSSYSTEYPKPADFAAAPDSAAAGAAAAAAGDAAAAADAAPCPHAATGLVEAGSGTTVRAMGMRVTIKAHAEQTGGGYSVLEYELGPGEGTEEHIHTREHEAWFMLDGQMTWTIEKDTYQATKGSFMHMPLGRAHSFRNNSAQPARMLVVCMPGGIEKYFLEIGQEETPAAHTPAAEEPVEKPVVDPAKLENALKKAMLYGLVYPKGSAA